MALSVESRTWLEPKARAPQRELLIASREENERPGVFHHRAVTIEVVCRTKHG